MTNTLHRFQRPDDPKDDYVVFCLTSKGVNDEGATEKSRKFVQTALKYNPVNVRGHGEENGPIDRPEHDLNFCKLYITGRKESVSPEQVIEEMVPPDGGAMVVFDNKASVEGFLKELKDLDLGLSVNVSSLVDDIREMVPRTGVIPHSVNYALGFRGNLYRLPERQVLSLTTLCGHGLVSSAFAKKMIDRVKEGRLSAEKAARYMSKFCVCGAFNTSRAVRILKGDL